MTSLAICIMAALSVTAGEAERNRAAEVGLVFVDAPALRSPVGPGIVGDCYAHNNVAERWPEEAMAVHEGTHGANSVVRNRYGGRDKCNAMYVLDDDAIVIVEPGVRLETVAGLLPGKMRGSSYDLYFGRKSLRSWGGVTLYVFDEWSAYTNCTEAGVMRGRAGGSDALQMAEFTIYALAAMQATVQTKPQYPAKQMRAAIAWMCECRVMPMLRKPGAEQGRAHWSTFVASTETAGLRAFCRDYFGEAWTKATLGF